MGSGPLRDVGGILGSGPNRPLRSTVRRVKTARPVAWEGDEAATPCTRPNSQHFPDNGYEFRGFHWLQVLHGDI